MQYRTFNLLVKFGDVVKLLEVTAVDIEAACNDVACAYGEFELVQYGSK